MENVKATEGMRRGRDELFIDEGPVGAPEDITPARTFFVRMVAQREIEVNETEWFEVLKRHGMITEDTTSDALASSRSLGEATTKLQIMKTPHDGSFHSDDRDGGGDVFKRKIPFVQVVSPFSIYYCWWQYFMMAVDFTYTAFWVPYSVVFVLEDCSWNSPTAIVDFVAGWLYVLDVLVNLRVGYSIVHKLSRTVELDGRRSASFYVRRGTFCVDVLATIPVYLQTACLATHGYNLRTFAQILMQLMRLLRLVRFYRLVRLLMTDALDVASFTVKRAMGGRMVLFQMVNIVILYGLTAHMMACAWYFTAALEDSLPSWPPVNGEIQSCLDNEEDDAPVTWLTKAGILCSPNGVKYTAAFYYATMTITTVGYGDIAGDTTAEQAVASVMMFIGAIFFGYLVSTTTIFLEKVSLGKQELEAYHEKVEVVDSWVSTRNIPSRLISKVRSYYSIVWSRSENLQNETKILKELPFPLRAALTESITMPLVKQVPCLSKVSDRHWKHISRRFRADWYPPGVFIAHPEGYGSGEGLKQEVDSLWLLERGEVACIRNKEEEEEGDKMNCSLIGPQVFGTSLILQMLDSDFPLETSSNAYLSTTPVWLWRVNKEYLQAYFKDYPAALVDACGGILDDEHQRKIQGIDASRTNELSEKVRQMKENLPPSGDEKLSLTGGASTRNVSTC
jgi:hypothetical protein